MKSTVSIIQAVFFFILLLSLTHCGVNIHGKFYPEDTQQLHFRIIDLEKIPENISHLKQLEELSFTYGKISVIENLDGLSNLNYLNLSHNEISNISGLETLIQLETLKLAGNYIVDIKNLGHLDNLKSLDLAENYIIRIDNLESLESLKELNITGNGIRKISKSSYNLLLNNEVKIIAFENGETNTINEYISNYSVKID